MKLPILYGVLAIASGTLGLLGFRCISAVTFSLFVLVYGFYFLTVLKSKKGK